MSDFTRSRNEELDIDIKLWRHRLQSMFSKWWRSLLRVRPILNFARAKVWVTKHTVLHAHGATQSTSWCQIVWDFRRKNSLGNWNVLPKFKMAAVSSNDLHDTFLEILVSTPLYFVLLGSLLPPMGTRNQFFAILLKKHFLNTSPQSS